MYTSHSLPPNAAHKELINKYLSKKLHFPLTSIVFMCRAIVVHDSYQYSVMVVTVWNLWLVMVVIACSCDWYRSLQQSLLLDYKFLFLEILY